MRESAHELGTNWAQIRPGPSLDHLIRPLQERGRDREVEGLRGLEVDHQLELGGLLHGEIARPGALQNTVDITCCAPELVAEIGSI